MPRVLIYTGYFSFNKQLTLKTYKVMNSTKQPLFSTDNIISLFLVISFFFFVSLSLI